MTRYTMQLREYIERWSQDSLTPINVRDKIETGRTKLFDFDYPIFNEQYKKDFETHFIRNFYMREIGVETEGLFKFNLESWLLINMPYFNKMFESELIEYNPLENSSRTSSHLKTNDKTQTNNRDIVNDTTAHSDTTSDTTFDNTTDVTDDNFNRQLESNNPDSRLTITSNDGQGVIEYASSIHENNENNSSHSVNGGNSNTTDGTDTTSNVTVSDDTIIDVNETENVDTTSKGKIGVQTYAKMIQEHRETFIRIEKQIFSEMQELFMLVY